MSAELSKTEFDALRRKILAIPPSTQVLEMIACDTEANLLSLDDINELKAKRPVKGFWKTLPKYQRRRKA